LAGRQLATHPVCGIGHINGFRHLIALRQRSTEKVLPQPPVFLRTIPGDSIEATAAIVAEWDAEFNNRQDFPEQFFPTVSEVIYRRLM
jgi:hypothetical protein